MPCSQVDIDTVEKFENLRATEQKYFVDMVQKCKDSGALLALAHLCKGHRPYLHTLCASSCLALHNHLVSYCS